LTSSQTLSLRQHSQAENFTKGTWGKTMNSKLDKYEKEIENHVSQYKPASAKKKSQVEALIDKANEKKSISLRLKINDLEQLKRKADIEGLPYQTLLSIVHKFVTDQLVDKRSILKSMKILKAS